MSNLYGCQNVKFQSFTILLENKREPVNDVCIERPSHLRRVLQVCVSLAHKVTSHCQYEYILSQALMLKLASLRRLLLTSDSEQLGAPVSSPRPPCLPELRGEGAVVWGRVWAVNAIRDS